MQAEQHEKSYSLSDLYRSQNDNEINKAIKEVAEEVASTFNGVPEIKALKTGIAKLEKEELAKAINAMFANVTEEGSIEFIGFSDAVEKFNVKERITRDGAFTRGKHFLQKIGDYKFIVTYCNTSPNDEILLKALHEMAHFILHWDKMQMDKMESGECMYPNDIGILEGDAWIFARHLATILTHV